MIRLTVRGLLTRKVRGALTAVAILLGVAMVAGTLMLTDSINRAFDEIFAEVNEGVDVSVTPRLEAESDFAPATGAALPERLLDRIRRVDGVERAAGGIDDPTIKILDPEGDPIGPAQGGPPQIAVTVEPEPFDPFTYVEGAAPAGPREVVIDSITAEEEGYEVGRAVRIVGAAGAKRYRIAGIAEFGSGTALGGASLAVFTLPEGQRLTEQVGKLDQIAVEAAPGVSADELARSIAAVVPADVEVRTGAQAAEESASDIKDAFGFLSTALLVFAAVALLVGTFLIFNTFSITVAQRTSEFALLRTLGASRRQLLGSVLLEAAVVGALASGLGILGGIGFVELITALFAGLGFELPSAGLVVGVATIVIPLAVGMAATILSATVPAVRATRVAPLEAMRAGALGGEPGRWRTWAAVVLAVAGLAAIGGGLFATDSIEGALQLIGLGLLGLFAAGILVAARIVRPVAALVGWPIERLRGVTGQLARENSVREASRTARSAAALLIGVALIAFVGVFSAAVQRSFADAVERQFSSDLAIQAGDGFSPIPTRLSDEVGGVEGVGAVSPLNLGAAELDPDDTLNVTGFEPTTLPELVDLDWVEGSDSTLAAFGPDDALLEEGFAGDHGIEVGDEVSVTTPSGRTRTYRAGGIVRDQVALIVESLALPRPTVQRDLEVRDDIFAFVGLAPGADLDATREQIDGLLERRFPSAETRNQAELEDDIEEAIDQLVALIYALLGLSVLISLLGVVNTLILTVYERTREIGMLRAIGTSRRQIRRMIRYESVITALIGGLLGTAAGLALAVGTVEALREEGLVLAIPVGLLIGLLALITVCGALAAIPPARRASRIAIVEALQYE